MESPPVLHLRSSVERAGPDSVLLDLLPALGRLGHRCDAGVISHDRHPDADLLGALTRRGVRAVRLPTHGPLDPRLLLALIRRCRGHAAIHAHDPKGHVYGALAAAATGLPLVATHHGWLSRDPREQLYERLDVRALRRARRVVCVSRRGMDELKDAYGVAAERLVWIPNGVDTARLVPVRRGEACARLGVDPRHLLVLSAGRLDRAKGFDVLLGALSRLESCPDRPVTAVILGEGPMRARLTRQAAALTGDVQVRLVGHVPDAASILGVADVFVLPSRSEQHPVALLEAMATGLAVVASDVGDVARTVGAAGTIVPPGDLDALATALGHLLAEPAARSALGTMARERVEEEFSAGRMAEAHARLYRSLQ